MPVVLAAVVVLASALAFVQGRAADRERHAAAARGLLFQAATVRDTQPATAVRLALAAYDIDPDTRAGLQTTLLATRYAGSLTELAAVAGTMNAAAVSADGHFVLTADVQNGATLWNVAELAHPRRVAPLSGRDGHDGPVGATAFSPDGRFALTGGADDLAILWDLRASPPTVARQLRGHNDTVTGVAFVPGEPVQAVTSADDGTVRLWDLTTGSSVLLADRHDTGVKTTAVAASPDRRLVLAATSDGRAMLWDLAAGTRVVTELEAPDRSPRTAHDQPVSGVAVSRAGENFLAVTASEDGTAALWELRAADQGSAPSATFLARVRGHADKLTAAALSPDGRQLVTAGKDRTAVVWNVDHPGQPQREATLSGHTADVRAVMFFPDGRHVLTAGDQTALLWDSTDRSRSAPAGSVLLSRDIGGKSALPVDVSAVALGPGGRLAVTGTNDGTAELIDLGEPARPRRLPGVLRGHDLRVNAVAFSREDRRVVTGSDDGTAIVWDTTNVDAPSERAVLRHGDGVVSVTFLGDENHVVTGSHDHSVRLWDVSDRDRPRQVGRLPEFGNSVRALAASENGQTLLAGSDDGSAALWDVSQPDQPRRTELIPRGDAVGAVALTPRADRAITADRTGRVIVWDLTDRSHPRRLGTIEGHTDAILAVGVSSDGGLAVTASRDYTSVLWDLHDPARPERLAALTGPDRPLVHGVALSPDGHRLIGASADSMVSVWDLAPASSLADPQATACRFVGRGLSDDEWHRFGVDLPYRPTCP